MSVESNKSKQKANDVSDDYRLVVYRSDDFREIRSFNLSLSNIYVTTSMIFLLLCALLFSLLAFTPMKRLIPGYGKMTSNPDFLQLVNGVDDLDKKIEAQGTYIGALQTLLGTGLADSELGDLPELGYSKASEASIQPTLSAPQVEVAETLTNKRTDLKSFESDLYVTLANHKVLKPVDGIVSSSFDPTIKHYGVDVLAPKHTPIIAIMDGIVISSGWDLETGYTIGIQHENNILSFYKHNSQLLKEKGTFVRSGETVAIIGNTGTLSSGPHLHFEIWHNGKAVNPQDILNF